MRALDSRRMLIVPASSRISLRERLRILTMNGHRHVLTVMIAWTIGCGSSVEVTSEPGLKCLDALYTAVTSRKPELLEQCSVKIDTLKRSGDLSTASAQKLSGFVNLAKQGKWEQSAEELDGYIRSQTRQ